VINEIIDLLIQIIEFIQKLTKLIYREQKEVK